MATDTTTRSSEAASRTRTTERRFFPELEGMRGFAALGVLTTHVGLSAGMIGLFDKPGHWLFGPMLQQLEVSLPIFFVLSGILLYRPFVLATIAGTRKPALKPYFWRRALRTLPAYWVLVAVAVPTLNHAGFKGFWQILHNILLLQVYQPYPERLGNGMEQTWSLATEVAFYAALPIMAWGLHRIAVRAEEPTQRARRILAGLSVFLIVGFAYAIYTELPSMGQYPIQNEWPIKWIGFIAVGMGLATLSAAAEVSPDTVPGFYRQVIKRPLWCWAGALAMYVIACVRPIGEPGKADYPAMASGLTEHVLYLAFGLLIVAPLTVPQARSRFIVAVLSNPVARFIGRISYGVYLWHIAIIYYWHGSLFDAGGFWELEGITLAGTLVAATLSYVIVERPAMKLRERLGKASVTPSVESISR